MYTLSRRLVLRSAVYQTAPSEALPLEHQPVPLLDEQMKGLKDKLAAETDQAKSAEIQRQIDSIEKVIKSRTAELRGDVGMTAQASAVDKLLNPNADKDLTKVMSALKDVNIRSLLSVARSHPEFINQVLSLNNQPSYSESASNTLSDVYNYVKSSPYTPNGSLGTTSEVPAIIEFAKVYSKLDEAQLSALTDAYESGSDSVRFLRDTLALNQKPKNLKELASFLADQPNGILSRETLGKILDFVVRDEKKGLAQLGRIMGMEFPDFDSAKKVLATPAGKARFYDRINTDLSMFTGTGADIAEVFTEGGAKLLEKEATSIQEALNTKAVGLRAIMLYKLRLSDTTPAEKQQIEAFLQEYNAKGPTWFTGEIRKVADGMFANIWRNMNAVGAGVTYEAFIKGLTVSIGGAIGQKSGIGLTLRYELLNTSFDTKTATFDTRAGIGASVLTGFSPFLDAGLTGTDAVRAGEGLGKNTSLGASVLYAGISGALAVSKLDGRYAELAQYERKYRTLTASLASSANLPTQEAISQEIQSVFGNTPRADFAQGITTEIAAAVKRSGGDYSSMSSEARALLIQGVFTNELEKIYLENKMNDVDEKSYAGWSIGVASITGMTVPFGAIHLTRQTVTYTPSTAEVKTANTVTKLPDTIIPGPTVAFEQMYAASGDSASLTFTEKYAPTTVTIDSSVGSYDVGTRTLTLAQGLTLADIVMKPTLADDKKKLAAVTVEKKHEAQELSEASEVRSFDELARNLQGSIYLMNRKRGETPANREIFKGLNTAIAQISDQNYEAGYDALASIAKKSAVARGILAHYFPDGRPDTGSPEFARLAALLTYTYGAETVKDISAGVDEKQYATARKNTIAGEKKLANDRWNQKNENILAGHPRHTAMPLSSQFEGQSIVASVFATPKGGAHRIDKFTGSIQVSDATITGPEAVTPASKEALIREHAAEITRQAELLMKFAKDAAGITLTSEKARLIIIEQIRGDQSDSVQLAGLLASGFSIQKEGGFFETRAMANGNVCMNKVEGIYFPKFGYARAGGTVEVQESTTVPNVEQGEILSVRAGSMRQWVDTTTIGLSLAGEQRKDEPRKPDDKAPETRPGEDQRPAGTVTTEPGADGTLICRDADGKVIGVIRWGNGQVTNGQIDFGSGNTPAPVAPPVAPEATPGTPTQTNAPVRFTPPGVQPDVRTPRVPTPQTTGN